MAYSDNAVESTSIWLRVGQQNPAYRITVAGTSIGTGVSGERAIDLSALAPNLIAGSTAWLWAFEFATGTGRTMAPVLGTVTDPAASLAPYVISFDAINRSGAGNGVVPRMFRVPSNRTLYLRPNLDSTGDLQVVLVLSQYGPN